jgi:hypothetical protein
MREVNQRGQSERSIREVNQRGQSERSIREVHERGQRQRHGGAIEEARTMEMQQKEAVNTQ